MMKYSDDDYEEEEPHPAVRRGRPKKSAFKDNFHQHLPVAIPPEHRQDCTVCAFETCWARLSAAGLRKSTARCSKCGIVAHATIPKIKKKIHDIEWSRDKTCFQMMHTKEGYEIWRRDGTGGKKAFSTQTSHAICKEILGMYNIHTNTSKLRKKNKRKQCKNGYKNNEDESLADMVCQVPGLPPLNLQDLDNFNTDDMIRNEEV
jgi:hypothetical protein